MTPTFIPYNNCCRQILWPPFYIEFSVSSVFIRPKFTIMILLRWLTCTAIKLGVRYFFSLKLLWKQCLEASFIFAADLQFAWVFGRPTFLVNYCCACNLFYGYLFTWLTFLLLNFCCDGFYNKKFN